MGVTSSLVFSAAGVSPKDAASNISSWIELFGIKDASFFKDEYAIGIGACLLVGATIFWIFDHEFIPISEASQTIYETTKDEFFTKHIKNEVGDEEVLNELAWYIAKIGPEIGVPLFGVEPPSTQRKRIDTTTLVKFKFTGNTLNCPEVICDFSELRSTRYTDVCIRSADLDKVKHIWSARAADAI